jgi:hypothetical protein
VAKQFTLYRFWNEAGELLYVGLSGKPGARWSAHRRTQSWWREVCRVTVEHFDNHYDLAGAEVAAIKSEKPKYNVRHANRPYVPYKTRAERVSVQRGGARILELAEPVVLATLPRRPTDECGVCEGRGWYLGRTDVRQCHCA